MSLLGAPGWLSLYFGSSHDLTVGEIGFCAQTLESLLQILCLSLSLLLPRSHSVSLSLSQKLINIKKVKIK